MNPIFTGVPVAGFDGPSKSLAALFAGLGVCAPVDDLLELLHAVTASAPQAKIAIAERRRVPLVIIGFFS
jgi:hypothetical protein